MNRRRPAFDPRRLDDIDDLLPAVPQEQAPRPTAPVPTEEPASQRHNANSALNPSSSRETPESPRRGEHSERQVRGRGGRPSAETPVPRKQRETEDTRPVPVAVRIPRDLYEEINTELLSSPERPSYGQLVVWTCEDHPAEVATKVTEARPKARDRRPRGRRLAADTVQVTLRLTGNERGLLDDVGDHVRAIHPGLITRTEIATAALRHALAHPPSST